METNQTQRPRFYESQYLGADDLNTIVEYSTTQQARHILGAHTWGIAMGLLLDERPSLGGTGQVDMYLTPGYAWDGFGRPIVVLAPYKIPAEKFKSYLYDPNQDEGTPEGRLVKIWLRYLSSETRGPRPGFEVCDPADQYSRIQESFQLVVGEQKVSDQHDDISVAGKPVNADVLPNDESVPFQTFPEDIEHARWLIPLGYVRWKPNSDPNQPGHFVERTKTGDDNDLEHSRRIRHYIGVVAEGIQAADGVIRMRGRKRQYSPVWSHELVWVEGALRVDGDMRPFGGKIDFRDHFGNNNSAPLAIQRIEAQGQRGTELQVEIGMEVKKRSEVLPGDQGKNRFMVGPLSTTGNNVVENFVVCDNGKVGIGTLMPRNALGIRAMGKSEELISFEDPTGTTKWHINQNLDGNTPGLNFVETNVKDGRLFLQAGGNVGIGTTNPGAALHVMTHLAVGPFSATQNEGGIDVTGSVAELSFASRKLGSWPTNPVAGDRFVWYNQYGDAARLWTEVNGDLLTIMNDGHMGIGITAPESNLHINVPSSSAPISALTVDVQSFETSQNAQASHFFRVRDIGAGPATFFYIRGDGNTGIGTDAPAEKLEVVGNIKLGANADLYALGGQEKLRIIRGTVTKHFVTAGPDFKVTNQGSQWRITFDPPFSHIPSGSVTLINPERETDNAVITELESDHAIVKTGTTRQDFTCIFVGPA